VNRGGKAVLFFSWGDYTGMMRDQKELLLIYAGKEEVFRQPPSVTLQIILPKIPRYIEPVPV